MDTSSKLDRSPPVSIAGAGSRGLRRLKSGSYTRTRHLRVDDFSLKMFLVLILISVDATSLAIFLLINCCSRRRVCFPQRIINRRISSSQLGQLNGHVGLPTRIVRERKRAHTAEETDEKSFPQNSSRCCKRRPFFSDGTPKNSKNPAALRLSPSLYSPRSLPS